MPKIKHNSISGLKKARLSNRLISVPECDRNSGDVANIFSQLDDEDFLDRTEIIMNKKENI